MPKGKKAKIILGKDACDLDPNNLDYDIYVYWNDAAIS